MTMFSPAVRCFKVKAQNWAVCILLCTELLAWDKWPHYKPKACPIEIRICVHCLRMQIFLLAALLHAFERPMGPAEPTFLRRTGAGRGGA
jgi:hypothetical protein